MDTINGGQIEKLIEDISSIKSVINKNIPYYIVPAVSIGIGFLYNFIGSFTEIRQYLIIGYWFLITGLGVTILNNIPAPISLSVTIGCGLLIFSALGCLAARTDREE